MDNKDLDKIYNVLWVKNEIIRIETKKVYLNRLSHYIIRYKNHTYKNVSKRSQFIIYIGKQN